MAEIQITPDNPGVPVKATISDDQLKRLFTEDLPQMRQVITEDLPEIRRVCTELSAKVTILWVMFLALVPIGCAVAAGLILTAMSK